MGIMKKVASKKRRKQVKMSQEIRDNSEEILETLDEMFRYFDLTEDSYSEPPVIAIHDGMQYAQGIVDPELHEILMRLYSQINQE